MRSVVSSEERDRAQRFRRPEHRTQFIVRRACLRHVLARYVTCPPQQLVFLENDFGKPSLAVAPGAGIQFNTSHSDGLGVVAVTAGRSVGIDVERQRASLDTTDIAELFAAHETRALSAVDEAGRRRLFFTLWSCKEAWLKARGVGLSAPLDSCRIGVAADGSAHLLPDDHDPDEYRRWSLRVLDLADGYAAALVAEGAITRLRVFQQSPAALQ